MNLRNIVLSLCLSFIKALWFIVTLHLYNFINNLQIKLTNAHNIESVDAIIKHYQEKYKGKNDDN